MIRRSTGFTLIEVMVGIGIVAVLGLSIGIIFGNITRLTAKPEAIVSAQVVRQLASLVIKNSNLCDNALRPAGQGGTGTHVSMNPSVAYPISVAHPSGATGAMAVIDHIQIYDPNIPGRDGVAISTNQRVGQNMYVQSITFYETTPGTNRSAVTANGIAYDVYQGYIEIAFGEGWKAPPAPAPSPTPATPLLGKVLAGGAVPPERIPITLAAQRAAADHPIDFCYGNAAFKDVCTSAGGTMDSSGNCSATVKKKFDSAVCPPASGACATGASYPVVGVWGFSRFDGSTGRPVCMCILVSKTN